MSESIKSLYIHFPFCRHLCNYCDFYKRKDSNLSELELFHTYLEKTWDIHQRELARTNASWAPLETLYIGGGTPSLWGERGAEFLSTFLEQKKIELDKEVEFTLEVNPGSWTDQGLRAWKHGGVNRYSLGIQSLDERFLKIIDRVHNIDDVYETLKKFKELQVNYSVDFMLGLPFSKKLGRNIERELETILKHHPKHISLYILTVPTHYVHYDELPDEEWIEEEFLFVSEYLRERGYNHYEVSNFALPGLESSHNLKYWKGETVAALGPSATGYLANSKTRYKWKALLRDQSKAKESDFEPDLEPLTAEQVRLESFYMQMRTFLGITPVEFFKDPQQCEDFMALADQWKLRGLVEIDPKSSSVRALPKGYLVLDSLMDELFVKCKSL